jgi:hypothetical protein
VTGADRPSAAISRPAAAPGPRGTQRAAGSLTRTVGCLVSLFATLACSGDRAPQSATTDSSKVVAAWDSTEGHLVPLRESRAAFPRTIDSSAVAAAPDPTKGRLRALRDSLAQFPNDPRVPDWLWESGMLMLERFAVIDGSGPAAEFARQRPAEFAWSQSYAAFFYTRYHLRELVRRFPKHERADDAAYRLADPVVGGECEGYVPCVIEYRKAFRALNAFLTQFPESEYAGEAVRRADDAFTSVLAAELANPDESEKLDPQTVDSLLDAYSSTVARLPDSLRARAQTAIAAARQMLDSLASAGLAIDHVILGIAQLDRGTRELAKMTGVTPEYGGQHPGRGTQNALLSLGDGTYIEILAPAPGADSTGPGSFLFRLDHLTPIGWAIRANDIDATVRRLKARGFNMTTPRSGSRVRPGGGVLEWRTSELIDSSIARAPFFIEWSERSRHPALTSPPGCQLESVRIEEPAAQALSTLLDAVGVYADVYSDSIAHMTVALTCATGRVVIGQ